MYLCNYHAAQDTLQHWPTEALRIHWYPRNDLQDPASLRWCQEILRKYPSILMATSVSFNVLFPHLVQIAPRPNWAPSESFGSFACEHRRLLADESRALGELHPANWSSRYCHGARLEEHLVPDPTRFEFDGRNPAPRWMAKKNKL